MTFVAHNSLLEFLIIRSRDEALLFQVSLCQDHCPESKVSALPEITQIGMPIPQSGLEDNRSGHGTELYQWISWWQLKLTFRPNFP